MAEPNATAGNGTEAAKNHFARALEEARAGAQTLADEYVGKFNAKKDELAGEAKTRSGEARDKANAMASDGKDKAAAFAADAKVKAAGLAVEAKGKASQGIVAASKLIDDNIGLIDGKAGVKYGDYARSTSQSMKDAAAKLDEKSLEDLGADAEAFIRKSPGLAVGMAVAAGFFFGRLLKGK